MSLADLIRDMRIAAIDAHQGPYGVRWSVDDHVIAQTGFVFETEGEARDAGETGPWATGKNTLVEAMCEHYPTDEGIQIWALIDTRDDTIDEILSTGGPI